MRYGFSVLLAAALLSTVARAQTSECAADPGGGTTFLARDTTKASSGGVVVRVDICIWRTGTGRVDFVLKTDSIRIGGESAMSADSLSTTYLFGLLAQSAVGRGVALGYATPADSCGGPENCRVYSAACVTRTGSGTATAFRACDSTHYSFRSFAACGTTSSPSVTLLSKSCSSCASLSGCESTCEGSDPGGIN